MAGTMLVAAQFQGPLPQIKELIAKTLEIFYSKEIYFQIDASPKMMSFRVLVMEEDLTPAKDALWGVYPSETKKLLISVDAQVPLQFTKNIIRPGQTVLIGSAPSTYKLAGAEPVPITGDGSMGMTHLAVEWDGVSKLRIKDMEEGNGVNAGGVQLQPGEWMEIEPGTKVRIGQTTLRFTIR